jgi:hypothetical protein
MLPFTHKEEKDCEGKGRKNIMSLFADEEYIVLGAHI